MAAWTGPCTRDMGFIDTDLAHSLGSVADKNIWPTGRVQSWGFAAR